MKVFGTPNYLEKAAPPYLTKSGFKNAKRLLDGHG